jgi:hypothetical protein
MQPADTAPELLSPSMAVPSPAAAAPSLPLPTHKVRPSVVPVDGDSSRRPRRDCCPNWTLQEMLALVEAKREEYIDELDTINARDLMEPDVTKWTRISEKVMAVGYSPCFRDHAMCKSKWHLIISEYRCIADYYSRMGTNMEVYWSPTGTNMQVVD